jgi:hypothetical protein
MKRNKLILILSLGIMLLVVLMIAGCGPHKLKGTLKQNVPPSLYWADVTMDSIYHRNPVLKWFSTDRDGQVLDYLYCILLSTTVDSLGGDPAAIALNFPATETWSIVHHDSATIALYASQDTSVFIQQYVFLKAMDDDSAFSQILYKFVSRNNHPPTCYIVVPTAGTATTSRPDPQWCLPETTSTWHGIRIAWVGKDSVDIPGVQPDFDWNVRIYGPFADSLSCDTLPSHMYIYYTNPANGSVWIRSKQIFVTNLETGWYLAYARNRDDAFVPSVPALGYMVVYEPTWVRHPELTKSILIANHSWYNPGPVPDVYTGEMDTTRRAEVNQYYRDMLAQAGVQTSDYDWIDYTVGNSDFVPQKADLYNHRLIIVISNDWTRPMKTESSVNQEDPYGQYLDVGGMLWVIGRRAFLQRIDQGTINFGATNQPFVTKYLNLSSVYADSMRNPRQAEFTGAQALIAGFPDVSVEPTRIAQTSNNHYSFTNTLRGVEFLTRLDNSETIYMYSAINPDTSGFNNFPVAIRYDKGTFKTSYFSFPLYFINTDNAVAVTRAMLDWYFQGI